MRYTQSAQPKSARRWDSSDMQRRFETALEAADVIDDIRYQLKTINYNKDLYKFLRNVEGLLSILGNAEVKARQSHKPSLVLEPRDKLANAIDYLEKMIIIAKLTE